LTRSDGIEHGDVLRPRARAVEVSVTALGAPVEDRDAVIAMLVEGSFDPEVRAKNYLPACMDGGRAETYYAEACGVVLRLGGRPVGVAVALSEPSPGEGVEVPAGSVELDMWVLAPFRGQGVRWFPLMKDWMARRFDHLVGVTWETNRTAIALLEWSGWKRIGRSFWRCETCEGHCEVFLYDLKRHREDNRLTFEGRHAAP